MTIPCVCTTTDTSSDLRAVRLPVADQTTAKHQESTLAQRGSGFTVAIMPLYLEGRSIAVVGRRMTVTREKPFVIHTKTANHSGHVQIAYINGHYQLDNQSRMCCRINGAVQQQGALVHDDEIEIGKDLFLVAVAPDTGQVEVASATKSIGTKDNDPLSIDIDEETTESVKSVVKNGTSSAVDAHHCDICDQEISLINASAAWTDGNRFICRGCLAKGVKPEHLPRPLDDKSAGTTRPLDRLTVESMSDQRDITETPLDSSFAIPGKGDRLVGESTSELVAEMSETDAHTPVASPSESDRYRQSRRISASRLAAIEPAPSKSFLSKVSKVFSRKDDREQRLELLEAQRKALLIEAGRVALGPGGSMGLPSQAVKTLLAGGAISLKAADLLPADLDRWRGQRQQMVLLDAEIAALRRSMGLGQDPIAHNDQAPPLRTDQKAQQERAFASMDGMSTDELSFAEEANKPSETTAKSSHSTGRLRSLGRRRR